MAWVFSSLCVPLPFVLSLYGYFFLFHISGIDLEKAAEFLVEDLESEIEFSTMENLVSTMNDDDCLW